MRIGTEVRDTTVTKPHSAPNVLDERLRPRSSFVVDGAAAALPGAAALIGVARLGELDEAAVLELEEATVVATSL